MEQFVYNPPTIEGLYGEIKNLKYLNLNQLTYMFSTFLETYIQCRKSLGIEDPLTIACKQYFSNYRSILKQENMLFNYMLRNIDLFDLNALDRVLNVLEEVNEKTVYYYTDIYDEMLTAAEMEDPFRFVNPRKDFKPLNETDYYKKLVASLSLDDKTVRNYLGYTKEFWAFANKHLRVFNTTPEIAEKMCYAVPIMDSNENICSVTILIPEVVDLETAIIASRMYTKAHDIFLCVGKKYNKELFDEFDEDGFVDKIDYMSLSYKRIK